MSDLISIYAKLDLHEAEKLQLLSQTEYLSGARDRNFATAGPKWLSCVESGRATILEARGKLIEAEAAVRKSIDEKALALKYFDIYARRTPGASYQKATLETSLERAGGRLALLVANQGRLFEAETVQRDFLVRSINRTRGYSTVVANGLINLSTILALQGRYGEAEQLNRLTVSILDTLHAPSDSRIGAYARLALAATLVAERRYGDAMAQYTNLRNDFANAPPVLQSFVEGGIDYAIAAVKTGGSAAALSALSVQISRSEQMLGTSAIDTVELHGVHAMALASEGKQAEAFVEFRAAQSFLIGAAIARGDEPSPLRSQRLQLIIESYLGLLADMSRTPPEKSAGVDAVGEAFRLADALRNQRTQLAVSDSAARAAANDPLIGAEIRQEQDLSMELVSLHRILRELMSASPDQQLPKVIADMQRRIEEIKKARIVLQKGVETRFPAYANLIHPQPPSLSDTRAVLREGEALLSLYATDDMLYVWAFKKVGPVAFARVKISRKEMASMVQALRNSLDPGDIDLGNDIPAFDLETGYRVYSSLLEPVATGWQGATQLLVVANGALSQLPLAVLPTELVTVKPDMKMPYAEYKSVPWLIRQASLTQLPSVNALLALRKLPAPTIQRSNFIGFGDPQFAEHDMPLASASTRKLRNLRVTRISDADRQDTKPVGWIDYSKIPALPDTREEMLSLAQSLKADTNKDVFLGAQASAANVKKLDLSKRRVVAFATHGLLPGDFPGVSEPSLALANPGNGNHGLLTLEDIFGLKLNADIVVLSACNTAAGDGQGADAISGLGRGFFYSGSRSILVTHWPVESTSARLIVTGLFERQARDVTLTRAEALRQSMLALMQEKDTQAGFSYAHPLFWAPYALIGEGGI